MTAALAVPPTSRESFFWSLDRYHRAIEFGVFTEEDRIELLYGKIVALMPSGTPHAECVSLLAEFFRDRFGKAYRYREEKPITLPELASEPEPDLVIVTRKSYGNKHPLPPDIHFIVEVASSSLVDDRTVKVQLYAEANLSEYWIVNLVNRQIEVHLQPDPSQKLYGLVQHYKEGERFTSPFAGEITVTDLLPFLGNEK